MPRGSKGPRLKKGSRQHYVTVLGCPPLPATEKPPPGIPFRQAHDLAFALSLQYGYAAVHTTEPRNRLDPYQWPLWRWRLIRGYRAAWYTGALGMGLAAGRPDGTGRSPVVPYGAQLPPQAPLMRDPTMERPPPPAAQYHPTMPSGWYPPGPNGRWPK